MEVFTIKNVAARPSGPQTYRRKRVWLTVIRVYEVQSTFRAVSKKQKDDLQKPQRASRYRYGA